MPFPAIKLFSLFAKQLSKPMAEYIKRKSKANYWLRTYICMPPAQCYHKFDIRLRMWASGVKSKKYKVKPLSEDMAIDVGADLIGETFLLSVAIGLMYLEYYRQSVNAARKDEEQDLSIVSLSRDVGRLKKLVHDLDNDIYQLTRLTEVIKSRPVRPP